MSHLAKENIYESQKLVDEYLLFHFGEEHLLMPHAFGPRDGLHFPERTILEMTDATRLRSRALDLGCAVGRSSFVLSQFCDQVVGSDFSSAFIAAAERIRSGQEIEYRVLEEANVFRPATARLPIAANPSRIRFEVGDACDLRADLGDFDLVHAANLICRLPNPEALLQRLPDLVRPGGELILTTPCTWLGEFTPPEKWPSGATIDWLRSALDGHFDLEETLDIPFLIRETARKFQWSVAQGSRWRRVSSR